MLVLIVSQVVYYFSEGFVQIGLVGFMFFGLLVLWVVKWQDNIQIVRLIRLSCICINLLAITLTTINIYTSQSITLPLFFFLSLILIIAILSLNTYSIQFQIDNINKWPTTDIMIRYTNTLREYFNFRDIYSFRVYLHGYAQIHRQKCDNPECPYRIRLTEYEQKMMEAQGLQQEQDLFRCQKLIKKIYEDGNRISPPDCDLQLQQAYFLYLQKQKEHSLKLLLTMKPQQLTFSRYYCYTRLKQKIQQEMQQRPQKLFLDLVSQLEMKMEEEEMINLFQKVALINLEFWSILNQDHPEFQKLNQMAQVRVKARQDVEQSFTRISKIGHSQKIANLYVHFLQAIANNQELYADIYTDIKEKYDLDGKITIRDWSNSSTAIILVSIEQNNYGTIIDINSFSASILGYQKYELINRSFNSFFHEDLQCTIKDFLSSKCPQSNFFLLHKSGYLLKINRKVQHYNSISTGMTVVCSLELIMIPNNCFIVFSKDNKVVGISASALSLLGFQLKNFQSEVLFKNFFENTQDQLIILSQNKQHGYLLQELLSEEYLNEIKQSKHRFLNFNITKTSKYLVIDFTQIKQKSNYKSSFMSKNQNKNQKSKFQFHIQASMQNFKYIGSLQNNRSYLSQFGQQSNSESLKKIQTLKNYSQNITTLRLKENIIQVIQEPQQQGTQQYILQNSSTQNEIEQINRKDEQTIFQSKRTFQEFIMNYKFGNYAYILLVVGIIGFIGFYVGAFVVFKGHHQDVSLMHDEITYEELIGGCIAKELAFIYEMELMVKNSSKVDPTNFILFYKENIDYFQKIKLLGSKQTTITILINNQSQSLQTNQFFLTYINYALAIYNNIKNSTTLSQIAQGYQNTNIYFREYLKVNSHEGVQTMEQNMEKRILVIGDIFKDYYQKDIILFVVGILSVIAYGFVMLLVVHRLNRERISILSVFLDFNEVQIHHFTSKAQKFLLTLHVEENSGDVDIDEQAQNVKKINNSTFSKKKRFKVISFNKCTYFKFLIIPLFCFGFFFHSFLVSQQRLSFSLISNNYFRDTSEGDHQFYEGLTQIQSAIISNTTIPDQSKQYMQFYHQYFDQHAQTYGTIPRFHQTFSDFFMLDICNGISSPYGNTSIVESCTLPMLYPNGSYLVYTDLVMKTQQITAANYDNDYFLEHQIMSKTHRKLCAILLKVDNELTQSTIDGLLISVLVWTLAVSVLFLLYGTPIMKRFLEDLNTTKNSLAIIPISLAKQLPGAKKYLKKIINSDTCF